MSPHMLHWVKKKCPVYFIDVFIKPNLHYVRGETSLTSYAINKLSEKKMLHIERNFSMTCCRKLCIWFKGLNI